LTKVKTFLIGEDGREGYSVDAPYDAIHVGAAAKEIPYAVSAINFQQK
jgi:protein-L-isoaspartate O-methyltransferase